MIRHAWEYGRKRDGLSRGNPAFLDPGIPGVTVTHGR